MELVVTSYTVGICCIASFIFVELEKRSLSDAIVQQRQVVVLAGVIISLENLRVTVQVGLLPLKRSFVLVLFVREVVATIVTLVMLMI